MEELDNWRSLNEALNKCSEKEAWEMLESERKGEARPTFLMRIYGRAAKLRADRERRDLMGVGHGG